MTYLIALVLLMLGAGNLTVLWAAPRDLLGEAFPRITAYLFGFFLLVGYGLAQPGAGGPEGGLWYPLLTGAAALTVVHALAVRAGNRRLEGLARPAAIGGTWAGATLLGSVLFETTGNLTGALALGLATSGLLMGAAIQAMLVGHWYLIDRKLDFWILRRSNRVLGAAVAAKAASLVLGVSLVSGATPELGAALTSLGALPGMVLAARVAIGLVLPAALVWMVSDCITRRSNQSATGLLYVLVCTVLAGEGLAFGLTLMTGAWL